MMAGGTGFAPLKGIIEHAFHIKDDRPIHLYWGCARREISIYRIYPISGSEHGLISNTLRYFPNPTVIGKEELAGYMKQYFKISLISRILTST